MGRALVTGAEGPGSRPSLRAAVNGYPALTRAGDEVKGSDEQEWRPISVTQLLVQTASPASIDCGIDLYILPLLLIIDLFLLIDYYYYVDRYLLLQHYLGRWPLSYPGR